MGPKQAEKQEKMSPGSTARPEVSWDVEEAYIVFCRCSLRRGKQIMEGFNPPWLPDRITDRALLDAIEVVKPTCEQEHLIMIVDAMDSAFLDHPKSQPKPVNQK